MVSLVTLYRSLLRIVMKIAGMRPQKIELNKGTVINFWVPSTPKPKTQNAVFLLHGFAADGLLTWQFQMLGLSRQFPIYVPDFMFFGESETDKSDRSPEFQADCVVEGLRRLGVEKCCAVGFSYGGFVGFKMAEKYGEMVETLVVSGSLTRLMDSFNRPALARIGGFKEWSEYLLPRTVEGARVLFDVATYRKLPYPECLLQDCLKVICGYEKKKEELLEPLAKDQCSPIPKYQLEIHLIWGDNDRICNLEVAKNLQMQLGENNAELHIIEKAGHLVMLERPCLFNDCFRKILAP